MRIIFTLMIVTLLYACAMPPETDLATFPVIAGAKCTVNTPTTGPCTDGDAVGLIKLDANGAPSAVNVIDSCKDKKVTWKYAEEYPDGNAPPFLVIFDPKTAFPGQGNNYKVLSKPTKVSGKTVNQEYTFKTRKANSAHGDCLNYAIMIFDKGLLDPVFIIRR